MSETFVCIMSDKKQMLKPKARIADSHKNTGIWEGKEQAWESSHEHKSTNSSEKLEKRSKSSATHEEKKKKKQGKQLRHFATLLEASVTQMARASPSSKSYFPALCTFDSVRLSGAQLLLQAISSECSTPALSTTAPYAIASGNQIRRQENRERHGRPEGQGLPPNSVDTYAQRQEGEQSCRINAAFLTRSL